MDKAQRLKLAAVSMVRDEADIIELFIKINSRTFDRIYIMDHRSTDGTAAIIQKLIDDGYPVSYVHYDVGGFPQVEVITHLVNQVAKMDVFDYIVPLDADEFLLAEQVDGLQKLDQFLSRDEVGQAPWRTYCPVTVDYFGEGASLYEGFRRISREASRLTKVVIGAAYARRCQVLPGNHVTIHPTLRSPVVDLPLVFAHVPIRSAEQIARKALLGSWSMTLKENRLPLEGDHWRGMAEEIRRNNYQIDLRWLQERAKYYVNSTGAKDIALDMQGPRLGEPTDVMVYKELAQRPLIAAMDDYIGQLAGELKQLRAQVSKSSAAAG